MSPSGRVEAVAAPTERGTAVTHLACSGLSAARVTPWGLYLVAAGASPLDGDALELDLRLEPGAQLEVRSIGALLARHAPGAPGQARASQATARAEVGRGARLSYLPAPGIAGAGSTHRSAASIELATGAELAWRDEVVLGRHGEDPPGTWWSTRRVSYEGRPLLASELGLGPGAPSWPRRSVAGGVRAFASLLLVAPSLLGARGRTASVAGAQGAALALEGPAVDLVALGEDLEGCRKVLDELAFDLAGLVPAAMLAAPDAS